MNKPMYMVLTWPPSKNNLHRTVRNRPILTQVAREYKDLVGWEAISQGAELIEDGEIGVELIAHRPSRRPDAHNYYQFILDCLEGICWKNDRQITFLVTDGRECLIKKGEPQILLRYWRLPESVSNGAEAPAATLVPNLQKNAAPALGGGSGKENAIDARTRVARRTD